MSLSVKVVHHINCNELYLEGSPLTDQDFFSLQKQVDALINNHESKIILNFESIKLLNSLGINNLIKVIANHPITYSVTMPHRNIVLLLKETV